jgi:hypothetical protein
VVAALVAAGLSIPVGSASATSLFIIPCDETSDVDETALVAAVRAANDETHHPGKDVIQLTAGCTYTLETPASSSFPRPGLPSVDSAITVWGNGAVIQGPTAHYDVDHLFWVDDTGDLTVTDLTLTRNRPTWVSGESAAVYNTGYLTLERVILENLVGGALVASGSSTTVKDSVFRSNERVNDFGGAISAHSSLILQNTLFEDNSATSNDSRVPASGGALYVDVDAGVFITGSTFQRNDTDRDGGAVYSRGTLAVTNSSFLSNVGYYGAAALHNSLTGSLTVTNSYFASNRGGNGGAIRSIGSATVTNSTFYANSGADHGGAISATSGSLSVTSSTFASNTSPNGTGDAIFQGPDTTGQTRFSVFDNNEAACYGLRAGDANITDHYDPSCPGNFFLGDPKLDAPAMNGGPTKTMSLGAGSAAAERISSGCPSADQRGYGRPSGPKCDIGAYEDQAPTTPGTPAVTAGTNPSKTGALTLGWAASTDADDTVTYRLLHKDADDSAYSVVGTTTATSLAVTESEGTHAYVVEAFDGNHTVASSARTGVLVDKSAPLTPSVTADRAPDYEPATGTSWYRDTVTVTTTSNGDPSLGDGSAGSGVASVTPAATYSTSGTFTTTGTATDAAGNGSPSASLSVNVDAVAPTLSFGTCPATVLLKHSASASWTASDPSSGLATPASGSFTLDTATIGHKSVSTTASDHVGHSTTATCGYDVVYDFTGFFTPLVNPPTVYTASAGQNVAISFSLAGNQGLGVIETGYPQSVQTPCGAFGAQTAGTATTSVKPGLIYSTGSGGRYNYLWKTSSSWRGTCRQLVLKLNDGTYHRANLSFA